MGETVADALSRVSGISRADMDGIWQEVKANHARLEACAGPHDFSVPHRTVGTLVRDWACSKCGGHVESTHRSWYETGLKHARQESA